MVTLDTIAQKCGVSKMTVSRVLGNKGNLVSEEKRKKILQVAKECNYRQNRLATFLNTGRTHLIAYLASEFRHFQSSVFSGIQSTLIARDYDILALQWSKSLKTGDKLMKSIVDRRVDGVMLFHDGPECDYSYLKELQSHNIPVVVLDRDVNISGLGYVGLENFNGGVEASDYLLSLGHKSVIFVCREEDWGYSTTYERYCGYKAAMERKGLEASKQVVIPMDIFQNNDYDALEKILDCNNTTAIVADNDVVAAHCILGLSDKGHKIPDDISVVGFGNVKGYVDLIRPALTTIDLDPKRIGVEASKLILDMIEAKHKPNTKTKYPDARIILPVKLVERNSAASPR